MLAECELTSFYAVDVFDMPAARKAALWAAMPVIEAKRRLRAGDVGDDEVFDVVLTATGDEAAAADALAARMSARLRNGETPGGW